MKKKPSRRRRWRPKKPPTRERIALALERIADAQETRAAEQRRVNDTLTAFVQTVLPAVLAQLGVGLDLLACAPKPQ
jgi:hypothetical protein